MKPSRENVIVAVLLGIGVACFALAFVVRQKQREMFAERPEATGDVGFLAVWAQPGGSPAKLQVGRKRALKRPQHLAFQFTAAGTGPRIVRIQVLLPNGQDMLMHEETVDAPKDAWTLDYILDLEDDAPDELTLVVAVDAPHTRGYQSAYPLVLGADR